MTLILAYQNRGLTRDIVINDANGDPIVPSGSDTIRAIIGREGQTPKLTVTSEAPTANGSSFTIGSPNRLRLDASDLDFEAGTYTLFIDLLDAADASEWKNVQREIFSLELT